MSGGLTIELCHRFIGAQLVMPEITLAMGVRHKCCIFKILDFVIVCPIKLWKGAKNELVKPAFRYETLVRFRIPFSSKIGTFSNTKKMVKIQKNGRNTKKW